MTLVPGAIDTLTSGSNRLLQYAQLESRRGNVLLIKHPALPWPECPGLERNQPSFDRAIHLELGFGAERYSGLECRSAELPFADGAFRRVVLWHVVSSGDEPEVAEALRVLGEGGELLVVGSQQASSPGTAAGVPKLQRSLLLGRFRDEGIEILSVTGTGLPVRRNWVVQMESLSAILAPFASLLLVRVRHGAPLTPSLQRTGNYRAQVAGATEAAVVFFQ